MNRVPLIMLLLIPITSFANEGPATMPVQPQANMSCKLSPKELAARRHELIPGLFKRAQGTSDMSNGIRFHFTSQTGLLADLARIIDQERDCCSFLRFELKAEPGEGPITFDVTGPEGTADMLRKL